MIPNNEGILTLSGSAIRASGGSCLMKKSTAQALCPDRYDPSPREWFMQDNFACVRFPNVMLRDEDREQRSSGSI